MRLVISLSTALVALACAASSLSEPESPAIEQVGRLESPKIDEASGLALSSRDSDLLWIINDDGSPALYAADKAGASRGRVKIRNSRNRDWEDLASFVLDGTAYLAIAETGDNLQKRSKAWIIVVEEPDPRKKKIDQSWRVRFRYPSGPRDVEAIAVDAANERVLLLSKREVPAVLYTVPLRSDEETIHVATPLTSVTTLPQPRRRDLEMARKTNDWFWQPTGMDLSEDGLTLAILTYGGIFTYTRNAAEDWDTALARRPTVVSTIRDREAESIVFDQGGASLLITREQKHAPLVRFRHAAEVKAAAPDAVTIMTFNVQNLFDNIDDPATDDKAYLPASAKHTAAHFDDCNTIPVESWRQECLSLNWSDAAVNRKLSVLADAIKQINNGRGADIIALQEVENAAILNRLREEHLPYSEYLPAVLIEGNDDRGIDVAFLSRLPLAAPPTLHPLVIDGFPDRAGDTRGVLEATFELPDGSLLTGYSVHFPAPHHPTGMRIQAYEHLDELRRALPDAHNAFAAGDFNTTSSEDRQQALLDRFARPNWTVSNDLCKGCRGTYYYRRDDTWSFLDMILFSPARSENTTWEVRADSVHIANRIAAQVTNDRTPQRHNSAARTGVSDHWPVALTLEPTQKQ